MFPRRRTDEVYRTLQQVQRRITESGATPTPAAVPAGLVAGPGARALGHPTPGPMPAVRPEPAPPPLLPPGHGAHQRYTVALSGTLVALLMVCWLASLAVAVLVTWQITRGHALPAQVPADPGIRAAPAVAPSREARWMLLVRSDPRATAEVRSQFRSEAERLNQLMTKNAELGGRPWFEVVEPGNGHVQLVYGRQGIDKAQWAEFYARLTKSRTYAGATWVEVP
jgi:hypothetical protein